jgi:hypothetical protein
MKRENGRFDFKRIPESPIAAILLAHSVRSEHFSRFLLVGFVRRIHPEREQSL